MGELKSQVKSFDISKREVWEAYLKVKANRGAPGVDGWLDRGIRDGSEGKPLQDLESNVLGQLFPSSGEGCRDSKVA